MCYNTLMKLKLNREFLFRHLFACAVFLALGGWFGYDAFVRYPSTPAQDLYLSIEGAGAPLKAQAELEAFKAQKVGMQRVFAFAGLLAGAAVGFLLLPVVRFSFSYDDECFTCGGVNRPYGEITEIDTADWEKKNILRLKGKDWKITLDAWHHQGVKEFFEKVQKRG